jgi:hypothetical protein
MGGATVTSRALEFHLDSNLLVKNHCDMCYSTNAATVTASVPAF